MATDFKSMKRKQLQALCKQHGLPAGKSNLQLADSLAALLPLSEERSKRRGCLRGSGGSSGEGRGTPKKVSFSIEDETKVRPDRRKRNIDAAAPAGKSGLDRPDVGVVPVRRTRSRSLGDAVLWSPVIEKKARKGTEGVRRNAEVVQDEVPVTRLLRNKAGKGTEGVRQKAKVFPDEVPAVRSLRNRVVLVGGGDDGGVQRGSETRGARKRKRTAGTVGNEESLDLVVYNEDGGDAKKLVKNSSSHAPATRSLRSRDVVVGGEEALLSGEFESRRTRKRSKLAHVAEDVEASPNGGALNKQPEDAISTVMVVSEVGRQKVPPRKEAPLRRSRRTLSKPQSSFLEKENTGTGKAGVEEACLPGGLNVGNEPVTVRRKKSRKNEDIAAFQYSSALPSEKALAEVLKGKHPEVKEPMRRSTRNSHCSVLVNEIVVPTTGDVKAIEKKSPRKRARNLLWVREVKEISGPKYLVATETAGPEKEISSEVEKHSRRSTRSSTRVVPEYDIGACENVGEEDISFKKQPRKLQPVIEAMQNPTCKSEATTTVAAPGGGKVSEIKEPLKGSTDYAVLNIPKISVPTYGSSGEAVQTVKKNTRGKQARKLHAVREAIESNVPNGESATDLEGNELQEPAPRVVQPQVARRRSRRNARDNDVSMFVDQKSGEGKQTRRQRIVRGARENYAFNVEAATELEAGEVQQAVQRVVQSEVTPRRSRRNARDNDDSLLVERIPVDDDKTVGGNKLWQLPEGGDLMRQGLEATLISNGRKGKQKREHDGYQKTEDKCNLTKQEPNSTSVSVKVGCPLNFSSAGGPANEVFDADSSFVVENDNTEVGDCNYLVENKLTEMQQSMLLDDFDGGPVRNDQMKTCGSGKLLEDSLQKDFDMTSSSQLSKKNSGHLEIAHEAREVSDTRFVEVLSEVAAHEHSNLEIHTRAEGTKEATSEGMLYADNKSTIQGSVLEKEEIIQTSPDGLNAECIRPHMMTTCLETIYREDHKEGYEDTDIIGLPMSFSRTKELSSSDITGDSPETDQEQLTRHANNHDAQETVFHINSCSPIQISCHQEKTICPLAEVTINNSVAMSCMQSSRNEDGTCVKASAAVSKDHSSIESDVAKSSFVNEVEITFTPEIFLSEVNVEAETGGNTYDVVEAEAGISKSSLHNLVSKGLPDDQLPNEGILIPVEDISTVGLVVIGSRSSCNTKGSKYSEVPVEDRDPSSLEPLDAAGEFALVVECNNDKDLIDNIENFSPDIDSIKPGKQDVVLEVTENDSNVSFPKSAHEFSDIKVTALEYPGCSNVNFGVDLDDKVGARSLGKLTVGNKDAAFSLAMDLKPDKHREARVVAMKVVAAELQSYTINGDGIFIEALQFEDGNKGLEETNNARASISCGNDEHVSSADVEASSLLDHEDLGNLANSPIANQMGSHDNSPLLIRTVENQAEIVECAVGSLNTVTESSLNIHRDSIVELEVPEVQSAISNVQFSSVCHDVVSEIKEGLAEGHNSHSGEDFSLGPRKSLTSTYLLDGGLGSGRGENAEGTTNGEVIKLLAPDNLTSNLSTNDKVGGHINESSAKNSVRVTDSLASECLDDNAHSQEGDSKSALAVRFLKDSRDPSASPIGRNTPEEVAKIQDSMFPLTDEEHRASTIPPFKLVDMEQLNAPANNHDAQETVFHINSCSPIQISCHQEKTICPLEEVTINNSVAMSCMQSSRNEVGTCVKASAAVSNAHSSEESDVAKSSFVNEVEITFTPEIFLSEVNVEAERGGNTNDVVEAEAGISKSSLHNLVSKGLPDDQLPNEGILIPVEDISTVGLVVIGSGSSCNTEGSKYSEVPVEDRDPSSLEPLDAAGEFALVVECNNDKDLVDNIEKFSPDIDSIKPGKQDVVLEVTENDSNVSFPKSAHEFSDIKVTAVEYPDCSNVNFGVDLDDKAGARSLGKLTVGNKDAAFSLGVGLKPDKHMEARVVAMKVVAAEHQSYTINGDGSFIEALQFEDGNKGLEETNNARASISCGNDEDVSSADVEASSLLDHEDLGNLANSPIANQMGSRDNSPLPIRTVEDQAEIVDCAVGSSNTVTESSLNIHRDSIVELGVPEVQSAISNVQFSSVCHDVVSEIKEGLSEGHNSHSGEDFSLDPRKSLTSTYLLEGGLGSGRGENAEGMTNGEVIKFLAPDNLTSNLSTNDKVGGHINESSAKNSVRVTDSLASECLDDKAQSQEGDSKSALPVRFLKDSRDPSASSIGCNTPEVVAKIQDSMCPLTDEEHRASTIPPSALIENVTILCDNPSMVNRNFCDVSFEELSVVSKGDRIPANYEEKPASPVEIPDSNEMAVINNVYSAVSAGCSYFGTTKGLSVDDQGISKNCARVSEEVSLVVSCGQSKLEACEGQENSEDDLLEVRASQLCEAGSSELEENHAFSLDDKDRKFYSDESPFSLSIFGNNFVARDSEITNSGFLTKAANVVDDRETIDNYDNVSTEYEDEKMLEKENTIDMDEFDGESVKSLHTPFNAKRFNDGGEICSAATSANSSLKPPNFQGPLPRQESILLFGNSASAEKQEIVNTTKVSKAIETHNEGSPNLQIDSIKHASCQMIPGIVSSTQLDKGAYHTVSGVKEIIVEGCPRIFEASSREISRGKVHMDKDVRIMDEGSESLIPKEASVTVSPLEALYNMEMAVDTISPSHIHTQGPLDGKTERLLSNCQSDTINAARTSGEVSVHSFTQREVERIKALEKTEAANVHFFSSQLSDSSLFQPFLEPNDSQLCEVVPDVPKGIDAHYSVDDHEVSSDESLFHLGVSENGNNVNDADSASLDHSQDVIWDSLEGSANATMDILDTAVERDYGGCNITANDIENSDASEHEVKTQYEEIQGLGKTDIIFDGLENPENANAHDTCAVGVINHQKTSSSHKEDCSKALCNLSGSFACEEKTISMDGNGEKSITELDDMSSDYTVQVDEEIFNRSEGKIDHAVHDGQAGPGPRPVGCNDHGQAKEPEECGSVLQECDGKETEAATLLISDPSLVSSKFKVIGSKEVALEVLSSSATNSQESNCENFKESSEIKDGYVTSGELNCKGTFTKAEHGCVDGDEIAPPDDSPVDCSPSLSKQEELNECSRSNPMEDINRRLTDFRISSAKKFGKLIESSPLKLARSFKYHSAADFLEHKENTPFTKIDRPMKGNVEKSEYASSLRRPLQRLQNNNTLGK